MINFKWGYGVAVSLVLGLSGCAMDERNPQNIDYGTQHTMNTGAHANNAKAQATTTNATSSKEPIQKSTPGPKRAAAPQIPVIQ